MKKRIFDKILIYLILFVIIINYGFNYTVLAESTTDGLDSITIEEGKVGQQTYIELKKQIVEELRNQLEEKYKYSGTVEELAETCGIDLEDGTAGTVIATGGKIIKIDDDTTIILGFNFYIDKGIGNITINDEKISDGYRVNNDANIKTIKIDGGVGNIIISSK